MQKATTKKRVKRDPAWKIIMSIEREGLGRPRFFSLHTLATLMGRKDLKKLAALLKKSGDVVGCYCPIVRTPVFYLRKYGATWTYTPSIWNYVDAAIKEHPFPEIKGFKANGSGHWTGGQWGIGTYVPPTTAMAEPFIEADYSYANKIISALKKAGYKPAIKRYKIPKKN